MITLQDFQSVFVFILQSFTSCWNLMLSNWLLTFVLALYIINSIVKQAKKLLGK